MRLFSVLVLAAVGAILGSIGGFFTAVFVHPEASPTFTFWGLFIGMAVLLWLTGSFGALLRGAVGGVIGAVAGAAIGWIAARIVHHEGQGLVRVGAVLGAIVFSLRSPKASTTQAAAVPIRALSPEREEARKRESSAPLVVNEEGAAVIPPYQSDGQVLEIQQLRSELSSLAPGLDLGSGMVEETKFMAADREYVEEAFYRCVARRMATDGIVEWTEAKFDCDDFANYLKNCANLAMLRSCHKGATHGFFVAMVKIGPGSSLLGVGGARDAYHANNLVRCTDGHWYFIEPQVALRHYAGAVNAVPRALRRFPAAESVVRSAQGASVVPKDWMCSASAASGPNQGGVELLVVRF